SRRRHTRFSRDWSSDVCSSDLFVRNTTIFPDSRAACRSQELTRDLTLRYCSRVQQGPSSTSARSRVTSATTCSISLKVAGRQKRSEERRVGKECGGRWGAEQGK